MTRAGRIFLLTPHDVDMRTPRGTAKRLPSTRHLRLQHAPLPRALVVGGLGLTLGAAVYPPPAEAPRPLLPTPWHHAPAPWQATGPAALFSPPSAAQPIALTDPLFLAPVTNAFGLETVSYVSAPTFADLDDDGDLDAILGEYQAHN